LDQGVKDFYCRFSRHLLADFVHGNPRIEAAIKHALRWIPPNAKRILDVGCGIGWSTWEIKRDRPEAFVLGVDLSSESIRIAQTLFEETQLVFVTHDISQDHALIQPPYDVIVMLDVYEHIEREQRGDFHQLLAKALGPNGMVVLTFPSVDHQRFLRTRHPEGLQPIDEDVTKEDISVLARDIDAEVVDCRPVNIWQPGDYVHLTLQNNSGLFNGNGKKNDRTASVEAQHARADRVVSRLKTRVTRSGLFLPEREGPVVCIISPDENAYSETFIRNHIERLPAKVKLLYGGWFPTHFEDGKLISESKLPHRAIRYASSQLLGFSAQYFKNRALKKFFQANRIDVVLAEYGPTGASIIDSCVEAGVPLVVHFHGFDAYDHQTLEKHEARYQRMFAAAGAIIAVSRDMERQLLKLGAPREKLFYSPYGVDTELFSDAEPVAASQPIFLGVGRFVDKKAPHLTLLAFKKLWERRPDARLKMIGDGPLWEACKQLARALGISHAVEFLGPRSQTEVALTMQQARAFVQHSIRTTYGDSEGTPVAVLEAGAAGLPVVATRHTGIQDVVTDGETGLLVNEGDVEGMARCMIRLAEDVELAGRLGAAARKRIVAEWSIEKSTNRLWSVMEKLFQKEENRQTKPERARAFKI
jgi:glycosyltransferase involved in cell wall biosynthesis/protein-L-isoaspartate O-methyltransferase